MFYVCDYRRFPFWILAGPYATEAEAIAAAAAYESEHPEYRMRVEVLFFRRDDGGRTLADATKRSESFAA